MKHVNKIVAITCCLVLGVTLSTSTLAAGNVETRNWYKSKGTINYSNQAVFSSTDFDTLTAVWSRGTSKVANEIAKYSNTGSFSSVSALKNGDIVTSQMVIDDIERIARNTNCNASKIVYGKKAFAYDNGSNPKVYDGTYRADKIKDALVTKGDYTGEATSEEMTAFILANWYGSADMPNTSKTYHTHSTVSNNETYTYINQSSPADNSVYDWDPSRSSPGGCYTAFLPWYHQHSTSSTNYRSRNANTNYSDDSYATSASGCFANGRKEYHYLDTNKPGACYNRPMYHKHSTTTASDWSYTAGDGPSNNSTNGTSSGCYTGEDIGHKHNENSSCYHGEHTNSCYVKKQCTGTITCKINCNGTCDDDLEGNSCGTDVYCSVEGFLTSRWGHSDSDNGQRCTQQVNTLECNMKGKYLDKETYVYKLGCNKSNSTVVDYAFNCSTAPTVSSHPYLTKAYVGCGKSSNVLQSKEWYVNCGRVKNQVMSVHINFEQD